MNSLNVLLPPNLKEVILQGKTINVDTKDLNKLEILQLYSEETSFVISEKILTNSDTLRKLVVHGKNIIVEDNVLQKLKHLKHLDLQATDGFIKISDASRKLEHLEYNVIKNSKKTYHWYSHINPVFRFIIKGYNCIEDIIFNIVGYNWLKI